MKFQMTVLLICMAAVFCTAVAVSVFLLKEKIQEAKAAKMALEASRQG